MAARSSRRRRGPRGGPFSRATHWHPSVGTRRPRSTSSGGPADLTRVRVDPPTTDPPPPPVHGRSGQRRPSPPADPPPTTPANDALRLRSIRPRPRPRTTPFSHGRSAPTTPANDALRLRPIRPRVHPDRPRPHPDLFVPGLPPLGVGRSRRVLRRGGCGSLRAHAGRQSGRRWRVARSTTRSLRSLNCDTPLFPPPPPLFFFRGGLGSTETGFVGFCVSAGELGLAAVSVVRFELGWGSVSEALVQSLGVEPGDPCDDGQLELGAGAPRQRLAVRCQSRPASKALLRDGGDEDSADLPALTSGPSVGSLSTLVQPRHRESLNVHPRRPF